MALGRDAPDWLAARGLHARLVDRFGRVVRVGDWPAEADFRPVPLQAGAVSAGDPEVRTA